MPFLCSFLPELWTAAARRMAALRTKPRKFGKRYRAPQFEYCESRILLDASTGGANFRINSVLDGNQFPYQREPGRNVASDAEGNSVVTWTGYVPSSGTYTGLKAQRIDATGVRIGPELRVDQTTNGRYPNDDGAVAMNARGEFALTWSDNYGGVFARLYSASGAAKGSQITVSTTGSDPDIAIDADGNVVVVYVASTGEGVYVRRINSAGALVGSAVRVDQSSVRFNNPTVAAAGAGNFTVAWERWAPNVYPRIYVRRFTAQATPEGNEHLIAGDSLSTGQYPLLAMNDGGDAVLVWHATSRSQAQMAWLDSAGNVVDTWSSPQSPDLRLPTVSIDGRGNSVLVFQQQGTFAKEFAPRGVELGSAFPITEVYFSHIWYPSVSHRGEGKYIVTWSGNPDGSGSQDSDIWGRTFTHNASFLFQSLALSNASILDSSPIGSIVGVVTTQSWQTGLSFTYSLGGSSDDAAFTMNADGTLRTAIGLNAATKSQYIIRVTSSAVSGETFAQDFTITVLPLFSLTLATSADGDGLVVQYNSAKPLSSLAFSAYRSASPNLAEAGARQLRSETIASDSLRSAGAHSTEIMAGLTLAPDTRRPYVIIVGRADGKVSTAYFKIHTLGAVSHGLSTTATVPEWEYALASDLKTLWDYDDVITFDWALASLNPMSLETVFAGRRLCTEIVARGGALVSEHSGDIVNLHVVGHSRGSVVISQALLNLEVDMPSFLAGGFVSATILDAHPASLEFGATMFSGSSEVQIAAYEAFIALADDPQVVLPSFVDYADGYFQHTPNFRFLGRNPDQYDLNLWGEGPRDGVIDHSQSTLHWFQLTEVEDPQLGPIGHSEVPLWYRRNAVLARPATDEDVNNDGAVDPQDVGWMVHYFSRFGAVSVGDLPPGQPRNADVNRDLFFDAQDILQVIYEYGRTLTNGEMALGGVAFEQFTVDEAASHDSQIAWDLGLLQGAGDPVHQAEVPPDAPDDEVVWYYETTEREEVRLWYRPKSPETFA